MFNFLYDWFSTGDLVNFDGIDVYSQVSWEPPVKMFVEYYSQINGSINSTEVPAEFLGLNILAVGLARSPGLGDPELLEQFTKFLREFCPGSENYKVVTGEGKEFLDSIFNSDKRPLKHVAKLSGCSK